MTQARGAQDADYLLFADADTVFEPGCIAASLALVRQRKLDLLSLISTLTHDTWFERVVQTAAALELMRQYPLLRANGLKDRRAFANGQFMLFTRAAYDAIGGHAAVKGALLEDLALARLIVDDRRRNAGVFLAAGLLHCRMYAGWAQFRRGWKRIYTEAADRKASRLSLSAVRVHFLGVVLPLWTLGCGLYGGLLVGRDLTTGLSLLGLWLVATRCGWVRSCASPRSRGRRPGPRPCMSSAHGLSESCCTKPRTTYAPACPPSGAVGCTTSAWERPRRRELAAMPIRRPSRAGCNRDRAASEIPGEPRLRPPAAERQQRAPPAAQDWWTATLATT